MSKLSTAGLEAGVFDIQDDERPMKRKPREPIIDFERKIELEALVDRESLTLDEFKEKYGPRDQHEQRWLQWFTDANQSTA